MESYVVMMILRLEVLKYKRGILTPVHNPFLSDMIGRCTHCKPVVAFGRGATTVNPILRIAVARCLKNHSRASIAMRMPIYKYGG